MYKHFGKSELKEGSLYKASECKRAKTKEKEYHVVSCVVILPFCVILRFLQCVLQWHDSSSE